MRFALFAVVFLFAPAVFAQDMLSDTTRYVSTFEQGDDGTDLVMVFFTSQDCYWSGTPEVQEAVRRAKIALQSRAEAEGKRFSAVAAVKNYDWEEGIDFLSSFGYFDEVIAGRSWFNTGVVQHCNMQDSCSPSTPMIRVFERDVTSEDVNGTLERHFGPREYLLTVSGGGKVDENMKGIAAWVEAGAPLQPDWYREALLEWCAQNEEYEAQCAQELQQIDAG